MAQARALALVTDLAQATGEPIVRHVDADALAPAAVVAFSAASTPVVCNRVFTLFLEIFLPLVSRCFCLLRKASGVRLARTDFVQSRIHMKWESMEHPGGPFLPPNMACQRNGSAALILTIGNNRAYPNDFQLLMGPS